MVERKNNKQKKQNKVFSARREKTDPGSMCVFIFGSPYSQLWSKPYA